MTRWFRPGTTTRAVTLIAISNARGIVSPGAAKEGCGGMTGVAIQRRFNVGGVGFGILANRCHTIMAGLAIINDAAMIESRPDETTGGMADSTILVCRYMAACFACGERAIMTRATVVHDANMIKRCR